MGLPIVVEYALGRLLMASKGYDGSLVINQPFVKNTPEAIEVASELGPSKSHFKTEHTGLGPQAKRNLFPTISWKPNQSIQNEVQEYCLIIEDPDSPIPPSIHAAVHGVFYAISPNKTTINDSDLKVDETQTSANGAKWSQGGFRIGSNARGLTYLGPRPPCGHGEHRYFFQVVALKESVATSQMSAVPTKAELLKQLDSKVIGHGSWIGLSEHKWQ